MIARTMRYILGTLAMAACQVSLAGTVAARLPVVVYDGPSENSATRYLLGKDYPVVVISETSDWLKVCMHDRTTGYLHRRDAVPGNNVVVLRPTNIKADPSSASATVMRADTNLLLANVGEPIQGWLPVRHLSGNVGFAPLADVWGHSGC